MFIWGNGVVKLVRYRVIYHDDGCDLCEPCTSEEHKSEVAQRLSAQGINFTIFEVDQSQNEWINGLKFGSYEEALKAFNLGEIPRTPNEILHQTVASLTLENFDLRNQMQTLAQTVAMMQIGGQV